MAMDQQTRYASAAELAADVGRYLDGDPVTQWQAPTLTTSYTRSGSVPFTIGQSRFSDLFGHQLQFSDTLSWTYGRHYVRFGGSPFSDARARSVS